MVEWTDLTSVCERFSQVIMMGAVILAAQTIARRTQDRRVREEIGRVRSLLRVGLRALRDLYGNNLRLLVSGDGPLLSGRSQIILLRTSVGRLVSLNELEIKAVMDANIAMELAETAMAVGGKPTGGVAFTLPPEGTERVKLPLLRAWEALETAEALLASATVCSPPLLTLGSFLPTRWRRKLVLGLHSSYRWRACRSAALPSGTINTA